MSVCLSVFNRFLFERIILNIYKHLGNDLCSLGVHKINSNLIAESQRTHLVKSPKVIDLIHLSDNRIVENTPGEITKSDRPGTQSDNRIRENTCGEITKSDQFGTYSNSRIRGGPFDTWGGYGFFPS